MFTSLTDENRRQLQYDSESSVAFLEASVSHTAKVVGLFLLSVLKPVHSATLKACVLNSSMVTEDGLYSVQMRHHDIVVNLCQVIYISALIYTENRILAMDGDDLLNYRLS